MPFRPAQVHTQQHLGEIGGIDAAGAGTNGDHGGTCVVLAVHEGLDLHVDEVLIELFEIVDGLVHGILVVFLRTELVQGLDVVNAPLGVLETLQLGLRCRELAGNLLSVFLVVPQAGRARLYLEILD